MKTPPRRARPDGRGIPSWLGVLPCALSASYYLAATTVGFGDPIRFLILLAACTIPVWPLFAVCRGALRAIASDEEADRVLIPSVLLLLVGLEAVRPLPILRFLLPFLAIGLVGLRAGHVLARAGGEGVRRGIEAAVFVGLGIIGLFFLFQPVLLHDAFQYVATLRGLLVGRSTDLFEDLFIRNPLGSYNPFPEGSLRYLGVPILEVPAYLAGAAAARLANRLGSVYPANGYTLPYLVSISLFSCLAGLASLLVSYRAARRRASRRSALLASVVFFLASPLVFFTFQWHGWTHTYGALLAALFLDRWLAGEDDEGRRPITPRAGFLLGVLGGWGMLVWPPAGLLFLLPAVGAAAAVLTAPREARAARMRSSLAPAAAGVLAAAAAASPQIVGWRLATGRFLGSTYANVGDYFDWLHPHLLDFLFSGPRHGAITWNPVLLLCIAGLFFVRRRREKIALTLVVAAEIGLLSCWSIWWSGIGFGNRFLLNLSPIFILGFARLLDRLGRGRSGHLVGVVALLLVFGNLSLISAYRLDRIRMGIKAPSYVQDPAPSTAAVAKLLLATHPFDPRDLLEPFHFNRNYFGERTVRAARGGRGVEVALLAGALLAIGATIALLTNLLVWRRCGSPRRMDGALAATLLLALSLSADLFLALACKAGPARIERTHLDAGWQSVERGGSIELVPRAGGRPTRAVHLLSFLVYSVGIREGTGVAQVTVRGTHGEQQLFSLRAGIETAECSYARPEFRDRMQHGIEKTDPVRMWMDDAGSKYVYPLYTYRARLDLRTPFEVADIEIRYVHRDGALTVTDVFLR